MNRHSRLIEKIIAFVHDTPSDTVNRVAETLVNAEENIAAAKTALAQIRNPQGRHCLNEVLHEWQAIGVDMTPISLGLSIMSAAGADSKRRMEQATELVWTGPQPLGSQCRQTEQVILELIRSARSSIYVVSFAAYKLDGVMEALHDAAKNGVLIRCVLESSEHETAGQMTMSSMHAFLTDGLAHTQVFVWPHEKRARDDNGRTGKLHAKCIVVDSAQAFISSANLTEHALNLNMELGILVRGNVIAKQITEHIDLLISHGYLMKIPEKIY